jgi:hypothetical protein
MQSNERVKPSLKPEGVMTKRKTLALYSTTLPCSALIKMQCPWKTYHGHGSGLKNEMGAGDIAQWDVKGPGFNSQQHTQMNEVDENLRIKGECVVVGSLRLITLILVFHGAGWERVQ